MSFDEINEALSNIEKEKSNLTQCEKKDDNKEKEIRNSRKLRPTRRNTITISYDRRNSGLLLSCLLQKG